MTSCFVLVAGAVFILVSILRWFEQTGNALDQGDWQKLLILLLFPFAVWFYPSEISAGRPTPVPHHDPVRGFGKLPPISTDLPRPSSASTLQRAGQTPDQPPPNTPAEFLTPPKIPPKKPKPPLDPEKLAKLKQKMKDQGMLDE
jgi:hypothetical protein